MLFRSAYNNLAGTKFKIVSGYRDTAEATLQLETGELQGIAYWSWSAMASLKPNWVSEKKVNILFHTGMGEFSELPGTPAIRSLVKDETDRKALEFLLAREVMGRPFVAPPLIPADRAKALSPTGCDRPGRTPTGSWARKSAADAGAPGWTMSAPRQARPSATWMTGWWRA